MPSAPDSHVVNGKPAGYGENQATKQTALERHASLRITPLAEPHRPATLVFCADNRQGTGGLFHPIRLSTADRSPAEEWIRQPAGPDREPSPCTNGACGSGHRSRTASSGCRNHL